MPSDLRRHLAHRVDRVVETLERLRGAGVHLDDAEVDRLELWRFFTAREIAEARRIVEERSVNPSGGSNA